MKPISFNLLDRPWIPCLLQDGRYQELGLRDVLAGAHNIAEVFSPSPPVTLGVHRLLLAILHRNFGPDSERAWTELWVKGQFDADTLGGYFESQHGRFDMFDPIRPFYQIAKPTDGKLDPIQRLVAEAATGNNFTLHDHTTDANPLVLSPAEAARYLVAMQNTALSSGKGKAVINGTIQDAHTKDAPVARPYCTLVLGHNLFETLMLNLIRYNERFPLEHQDGLKDLPSWEQDQPGHYVPQGTVERGYVDWLTWQSRHIHLVPSVVNGEVSVSHCIFLQGLVCREADKRMAVRDPFVSYLTTKDGLLVSRKLDAEKVVWRDLHALLQFASDRKRNQSSQDVPLILDWLAEVYASYGDDIGMAANYRLAIVGMETDQAKINLWRQDRLPLPLAYLSDGELTNNLKDAILLAEAVEKAIYYGVSKLASGLTPISNGKPTKDTADLVATWQHKSLFWAALERPFRTFVTALPEDPDGQIVWWREQLALTAKRVFGSMVRDQIGHRKAMQASADAEKSFYIALSQVFNPSKE